MFDEVIFHESPVLVGAEGWSTEQQHLSVELPQGQDNCYSAPFKAAPQSSKE